MIVAILALAAAAPTVIDAERAFVQMAQDRGQWTAFRATAAPDAVLFMPQPVNAHEFLKPLKDPPKAVRWWPVKSWQSCDGTLAVNTGGAVWPDGHYSYFTTVWQRQSDGGWKWVYDNGVNAGVKLEQVTKPITEQSPCKYEYGLPPPPLVHVYDAIKEGGYTSKDGTLGAGWFVTATGRHDFHVWQAGKSGFVHTLDVPAPTK